MSDPYETDESVEVWAFFNKGIFPIAMKWRRRLVRFDKVIFSSIARVGDTRLVRLVVKSDSANFELEFNATNYLWKVKKVIDSD